MLREGKRLLYAVLAIGVVYLIYVVFFAYPFEDFRLDVIEDLTLRLPRGTTEDRIELQGYLDALKATTDEDAFVTILDQMPDKYFDE